MEAARPATAGDIDRILELSRALRTELATQRGGDLWWRTHDPVEHHPPGLRALLGYDDDCLLVGSLDDQVVGYAIARAHRLPDGSHLAVIGELFVEPGAREVAVGEALVNARARPGPGPGAASASTPLRCPATGPPRTSSRPTASWPAA